jgi:hypothetical protein
MQATEFNHIASHLRPCLLEATTHTPRWKKKNQSSAYAYAQGKAEQDTK